MERWGEDMGDWTEFSGPTAVSLVADSPCTTSLFCEDPSTPVHELRAQIAFGAIVLPQSSARRWTKETLWMNPRTSHQQSERQAGAKGVSFQGPNSEMHISIATSRCFSDYKSNTRPQLLDQQVHLHTSLCKQTEA